MDYVWSHGKYRHQAHPLTCSDTLWTMLQLLAPTSLCKHLSCSATCRCRRTRGNTDTAANAQPEDPPQPRRCRWQTEREHVIAVHGHPPRPPRDPPQPLLAELAEPKCLTARGQYILLHSHKMFPRTVRHPWMMDHVWSNGHHRHQARPTRQSSTVTRTRPTAWATICRVDHGYQYLQMEKREHSSRPLLMRSARSAHSPATHLLK